MFKTAYSVFDSKALIFGNPFYAVNDQVALRDFATASGDPGSAISKNPSDYTLFRVGTYEDDTGKLYPCEVLVNLGLASQFIKPEV